MHRLLCWSARSPLRAIGLALLITALAAGGLSRVRFGTTIEALFRDRGGEYARYQDFEANFGAGGRTFVVATGPRLFETDVLTWLRDFDEGLSSRPEIAGVESLFRISRMERTGNWLLPKPAIGTLPTTGAEKEALLKFLLSDRRIRGNLLSPDGSAICFLVELQPTAGNARLETSHAMALAAHCGDAAGTAPPGVELFTAGTPLILAETNAVMKGDWLKLLVAILVFLSAVMLLFFRSWLAILPPATCMLLGAATTLGFTAWMEYPVTIAIVPAILLVAVVSVSEGVYLVSAFQEALAKGDSKRDANDGLGPRMGKTLFLSAITSAAGFATVALASNVGLQRFALVGAFGILANLFIAALVIPGILALLPSPRCPTPPPWIRRMRVWLVRLPDRPRRKLGWLCSLVLLGIGTGIVNLRVDTSYLSYLPHDNPLVKRVERFRSLFGGASYDSVVVETHRPGGVFDPGTLSGLEHLRARLAAKADFVYGLPDLLADAERSFPSSSGVEETLGRIPRELLREFVDHDGSRARFWIRSHAPGSGDLLALDRFIASLPRDGLSPPCEISLMSQWALAARMSDRIVKELLWSLSVLAIVTAAILGFALRSARLGLIALVPNALPLLATYGWMGWLGIEMGMGVFAVGVIAFAVSVNDTLHLLITYHRRKPGFSCGQHALRAALGEVVHPIIVTSAIVCAGFLALLVSDLAYLRETGLLLAISLFSAMTADLFVTPLLAGRTNHLRPAVSPRGDRVHP